MSIGQYDIGCGVKFPEPLQTRPILHGTIDLIGVPGAACTRKWSTVAFAPARRAQHSTALLDTLIPHLIPQMPRWKLPGIQMPSGHKTCILNAFVTIPPAYSPALGTREARNFGRLREGKGHTRWQFSNARCWAVASINCSQDWRAIDAADLGSSKRARPAIRW